MKAEARAEEDATPDGEDKCAAEGICVVKLLLEVMKEEKMSRLPEKDWLFVMENRDDLSWLLEALGNKAKLIHDSL